MATITGSSALKGRSMIALTFVSAAYLSVAALLLGFKGDQVFLVVLFNACYYASRASRRFILALSVFIVFWILFDFMKAFPNYLFNRVHIGEVYTTEKWIFGIGHGAGGRLTPNEFWLAHGNAFLDLVSGLSYLCWIPLPLGFGIYLFYRDRRAYFNFSLTFLLTNLLGFMVYYIYPAAPPWYVELYGFAFHAHTPGNTAGLGRFDELVHIPVFASLYAKSSNVFAAMPSLHASYPLIVFYYALREKLRKAAFFSGAVMLGIWFAAVYSSHHYVLDVVAGICCGICGIALFNLLFARNAACKRLMNTLVEATRP